MRADWGRTQTAGQVRGPGVTRAGILEEVGLTQPLKVVRWGRGRGRGEHGAGEQSGLPAESTELGLHRPE